MIGQKILWYCTRKFGSDYTQTHIYCSFQDETCLSFLNLMKTLWFLNLKMHAFLV